MLPGPVFNVELITTARRARYYAIRFVLGMLLLYSVVQVQTPWPRRASLWSGGEASIREMAAIGMSLFATITSVQGVAVLLLTPALVAGVVADEKRRKTLHYLMSSRLSSAEIILGKLFARLLHIGVFLAVGLPVLSLISLFGGVEPLLVVMVYAGTFSTAFFLAALAVLISTLARRPREAVSQVYILEIAWLFVPSLISWLMPMAGGRWVQVYEWIKPVNDVLRWSSPFSLVQPTAWGGLVESAVWMFALQAAFALGFLLIAIVVLRPLFRREGEGPRRLGWLVDARRGRRFLPRPEVGDDAMLWKERYVSRTSAVIKIASGMIFIVVISVLGYATYQFAEPAFVELWEYGYGASGTGRAREDLNGYLRAITTVIYVAWGLGVAGVSAAAIASEREEDTWTSLTATPLSGEEILRAKMFGAVWGTRWLGLLLAAFWLLGLVSGAVHPIGFAAVAVETTVFIAFVVALGTALSLSSKTTVWAQTWTIAILMISNWAYLLCCIPLEIEPPLVAVGVTPMIEAISLMSYQDVSMLSSGFHGGAHSMESVMTCGLSVLLYGVAALLLTLRSFLTFDARIDRPRRQGGPAPVLLKETPPDEEEDV
jgi:ABC-type transport system involved in multi-copper enzyme maturation permease subunit